VEEANTEFFFTNFFQSVHIAYVLDYDKLVSLQSWFRLGHHFFLYFGSSWVGTLWVRTVGRERFTYVQL